MSKSNLLELVFECSSQEELMDLWNTLTDCERKAYKKFFTGRKAELNG